MKDKNAHILDSINFKIIELEKLLNDQREFAHKQGNPYITGLSGRISGLKEALELIIELNKEKQE